MFFLYILYSHSRDRYYIGTTGDLKKRLQRHNEGASPYTKIGRPWSLVYEESFTTRSEAEHRERYLKRMKSRALIERLLANTKEQ